MGALSLQNRTIGLIENGTWGPVSAKQMQQLFSEMKQMNVLEPVVTIKSSVKEDPLAALCALKDRILASCTKRCAQKQRWLLCPCCLPFPFPAAEAILP